MTVIKVNLLDYRKLKRIMQLQKEFLLYLLGISIALVTIGIFWQNQNNRIIKVNSEITYWNVELKKIDKTVKKVDEAKAKKKRITHILKSIKILKNKQTDPAQLLDEINKNLPSEVWLTRFDETGAKVRLEGYSFSDPAIAVFMKNLEKLSAYFRSIELIETRRAKVSGEIVRRFSIQCTR
tara:strand:+ start:1517 stop:2059 length:543 start_codon:yes stop_codon:yes gene_type:complete